MADIKYKPFLQLCVIFIKILIFGAMGLYQYLVSMVRKGPRRMFYKKERTVRPAVLSNKDFGSHEFMMLKNSHITLHYVISGPKDKPFMLFLHGFPEFWYSWRHQLKEFCKDYRVCAIDMRGYGDSSKPTRVEDYHIDELIDDVRQFLDQLGYRKCILVAHDWGGVVAWFFAMKYPDMLERLIMCNIPHPVVLYKHMKFSLTQAFKSWYMFFFQLPILPILYLQADDLDFLEAVFTREPMGAKEGSFTEEDVEAFKYALAEYHDMLGPVNYYRSLIRHDLPAWARGKDSTKIGVPTLMVWGTKDAALGSEMADMTAQYVEDYTLKWVEGAKHWVQQEEPAIVNQHIREFLKRR